MRDYHAFDSTLPEIIHNIKSPRPPLSPYLMESGRGNWNIFVTKGRLSVSEKGPMTWPSYFLIIPARAGTDPGTFASEMRDMRPIIAKRPLLISIFSFVAFCSSVNPFVIPTGSKRGKGRSMVCLIGKGRPNVIGTPLNSGKAPGLP